MEPRQNEFIARLLVAFLTVLSHCLSSAKERTCCKYAFGKDPQSVCQNDQGCILSNEENRSIWSPDLQQCKVAHDSKKDDDRDKCWGQNDLVFEPWGEGVSPLRFKLQPYVFQNEDSKNLSGIDVQVDYGSWKSVSFRMFNTEVCPDDPSLNLDDSEYCKPRCVHVLRQNSDPINNASLNYDCELGFYVYQGAFIRETSGDTYQIDFCEDKKCGSFLFTMPEVGSVTKSGLLLLDKILLNEEKRILIHMPENGNFVKDDGFVDLILKYRKSDDDDWELTESRVPAEDGEAFLELKDTSLKNGFFRICVLDVDGEIVDVASFSISSSNGAPLGVVLVLLLLFLICGAGFYAYYSYQKVKKSSVVNPNRLMESGRIKPRSVFVITNVDNRHHVDVVLEFNKYLKVSKLKDCV